MTEREVHREPESDPDDDELLKEDQISHRQFLESVYGRRLRAFTEILFKGKTYGGDGPDDVVQQVLAKVANNEEEWKGRTVKSLRGRLYESAKHDFIDLTRKHRPERHEELDAVHFDSAESEMRPAERMIRATELASFSRFLKQQVPNDKGQHKCIDLLLAKYTVSETAEELGLSVDQVKKMRGKIFATLLRAGVTREMIPGL